MHRRIAPFADRVLPFAATITMLAALWCVFVYAPNEQTMGEVQRIFYFHVNCWWAAYLGFFIAAGASAAYLRRGRPEHDWLAQAGVEVGFLFCTMGLVTGPIWARPIWGAWWTWDPRLTMAVILWTIFSVYLVLRSAGREEPEITRYAAVLAIVGILDIPLIMVSVRLWRHALRSSRRRPTRRSRGSPHGGRAPGHARGLRALVRVAPLVALRGSPLARRAVPSGRPRGRARPMNLSDRFWFLFAAYGAIWVLLALFLVHLGRRHRVLERELRALATRLSPPTS